MLLSFGDAPTRKNPKIWYNEREFEGVDDPEKIRWRAFWAEDPSDSLPGGIELRCYPVVRRTRCGAWIATEATRQATRQPWEEGAPAKEWAHHWSPQRFVYDDSNAAWAKPTRAGALRSLGIRLTRWSANVRRDVARLNAACDVAAALLTAPDVMSKPDHAVFWTNNPASQFRIEVKE